MTRQAMLHYVANVVKLRYMNISWCPRQHKDYMPPYHSLTWVRELESNDLIMCLHFSEISALWDSHWSCPGLNSVLPCLGLGFDLVWTSPSLNQSQYTLVLVLTWFRFGWSWLWFARNIARETSPCTCEFKWKSVNRLYPKQSMVLVVCNKAAAN